MAASTVATSTRPGRSTRDLAAMISSDCDPLDWKRNIEITSPARRIQPSGGSRATIRVLHPGRHAAPAQELGPAQQKAPRPPTRASATVDVGLASRVRPLAPPDRVTGSLRASGTPCLSCLRRDESDQQRGRPGVLRLAASVELMGRTRMRRGRHRSACLRRCWWLRDRRSERFPRCRPSVRSSAPEFALSMAGEPAVRWQSPTWMATL